MTGGKRSALIVAGSDYSDPELRQLQAPASDAGALEAVLTDPGVGGFEVRTLLNKRAHEVNLAVEEFFADRQPDDLLLVHFSCHGVKDEDGELYFAMSDTLMRRLASTAVAANFVNHRMRRSRSNRVVLLLDCCYAGAFERGLVARGGAGVGIEAQFGGGRGRTVITASDAVQYAYENGQLTATGQVAPSVFTSALVNGLETGEADRDQDGQISLDELYDYVYDSVTTVTPNQTPCKWTFDMRGKELVVARRSRPVTTPAPLPEELKQAIENRLASVRAGAVQELEVLLHSRHQGLALAARLALERLAEDDSRMVSATASAALGAGEPEPRPEPPRLELSATSLDFGQLTHHSQPPEHRIRLHNAGGGSLNARAAAQADWIQLRQARDEVFVSVDTNLVGEHEGTVTVDSDGGSAVVVVKARIMPPPPPEKTPAPPAAFGAAKFMDMGFAILFILLCIVALNALIRPTTPVLWLWWIVFAGNILGIALTLGGIREHRVPGVVLLWAMTWTAVYSISVIGTIHSTSSTLVTVLSIESIIGAIVNGGLCVWIVALLPRGLRYVNPFLAISIGLFSVAFILAAVAFHTTNVQANVQVWTAVGWVTFASALGVLLTLIRAHRPGMTS